MQKFSDHFLKRCFKWCFYSILVGLLAGTASAVFLISLNWATQYREVHPWIIGLLPLGGLCIGYFYYRFGKGAEGGTGLILEQIHDPSQTIPLRMAPFVLLGTVITHLFGGSAGREGTAVQMGATLADQLRSFFPIAPEDRKILLITGAGAGFSAAIGAPLAGAIFGLEVIQIGKLRPFALFECLVSSYVAYYTCVFWGAPHSHFPQITEIHFNAFTASMVVIAGMAFGLSAHLFVRCAHLIEQLQKKYILSPIRRPVFAGFLIILLYWIEGSYRYAGLGIPYIQKSFSEVSAWYDPLWKTFFTALTIGSGFKGGEFIPLVFIGTTLGSFLSPYLDVPLAFLAALGFAAVFGAGANTPIACAIMACEIFGWKIAPYAFLACWIAYHMTGHEGVYKNQKIVYSKKDQLRGIIKWPQEIYKRYGSRP